MQFRISSALAIFLVSTQFAFSSPKEDCESAVKSLGYPIEKYSFVEAGIFTMERHVFYDTTICYVNAEGKIDSIYRGESVLAKDGYFGLDALQRKRAIEDARQMRLDTAYREYQATIRMISEATERELLDLRASADPLLNMRRRPDKPKSSSEDRLESPMDKAVEIKSDASPEATQPPPVKHVSTEKTKWTTEDRVTTRTCPSERCGVTGWVTSGTRLKIYEERDGWSRIEEPRSAMCIDGKSGAVDSGNDKCTNENGIIDGQFSRWVSSKDLSNDQPARPIVVVGCENLGLEDSDNYAKYSKQFCSAALKMIKDRKCRPKDFQEWSWSSSPVRGRDYYFTYCGGMTKDNRYYLNVRTGEVSK